MISESTLQLIRNYNLAKKQLQKASEPFEDPIFVEGGRMALRTHVDRQERDLQLVPEVEIAELGRMLRQKSQRAKAEARLEEIARGS